MSVDRSLSCLAFSWPFINLIYMSIVYITYFLLFSIILSVILIGASFLLVEKTPGEGKISTYECGFAPIKYPTSPFTIKFFVVGIIFLIFDLEIIYLIG